MKSTFSRNIFIGLFSGIALGLFIGDYAAPLVLVGDAFIGLMQMTVLPYIMVSLLSNLAKVDLKKGKKLLKAASAILSIFMLIGLGAIIVLPLFFPEWESSSFFSTSLLARPEPINFIDIYIPSNIFSSLSNNVVPAVVLFSIIVGISLNNTNGKQGIIDGLDIVADALNKANKYIVKLTPYGIFGIAAYTTGTFSLSDLGLIQVYLITYLVAVIVLGFVFLPGIVGALTPFKYKDFLGIPKGALITIFATGKIIILLPQLIEDIKKLFERYGQRDEDVDAGADLMMPLAYPFPNLGTLVIMVFVPFAAWFAGKSLPLGDQLILSAATALSSFVAPVTGIPFLLDLLKLPGDLFQLFVVSSVFTDRIRVVLGAIHLLALSVLAISYAKGILKLAWGKVLRTIGISLIATIAIMLPVKMLIGDSFQKAFNKYESFVQMDLRIPRVNESFGKQDSSYTAHSINQIKARKTIRVGFYSDALPYVFRNAEGAKVGFDVELWHLLARDLDVSINWIEVPRGKSAQYLNSGQIDAFSSGVPKLPEMMNQVLYSSAYTEVTFALIADDFNRNDFVDRAHILSSLSEHTFAVNSSRYFEGKLSGEFNQMKRIDIGSPRAFFKGESEADVLIFSAEAGSAWTLVYPGKTVIVPEDIQISLPVAIQLPMQSKGVKEYLDQWIELRKMDGTMDRIYKNWILGEASLKQEKHWSVIRDVFGWVN